MASRAFQIVIVVFWLASMWWLTITKLIPLLLTGDRPDYHAALPTTSEKDDVVGWELQLNHRPIGWAVNQSHRLPDGAGHLHSIVHFDQLPVAKILERTLPLLKSLLPAGDQLEITAGWELTIRSRVEIGSDRRLQRMQTAVDLGRMRDVIQLNGRVEANNLHIQVATTAGLEDNGARRDINIFERDFEYPAGDVVADSLSPQPRLDRLRVGQAWTIRTYQLIAAQPTMQVIEARVESDDFITWDDQPVHVRIVAYRTDAGSGLSAARDPIARLWVAEDGQVLRQEMMLADLRFVLVRMPNQKLEQFEPRFKEFLPAGALAP